MVQIRSASGPAAMNQQTSLTDLGDTPEFVDDDVINMVSEGLMIKSVIQFT